MTGEITAVGEMVTGALLGRAVEPHAGEGHGDHGGICLNCGTALIGAHCHRCGQSGHVHRTLGGIGHELVHGVFHFDGKLWRTLPLLAWRPGQLTRRYIDGERARFVSPIALFLFTIFALFAVFSWLGVTPSGDWNVTARTPQQLQQLKQGWEKRRDQLVAQRAKLGKDAPGAEQLDEAIDDMNDQIAGAKIGQKVAGPLDADTKFDTGWHMLDHGLQKWVTNPSLMVYKMQSSSYKFSWLLIPLSLPFLWLMFAWRRQFKLYDHAVFVTYSIAFMSVLFIIVSVLEAVGVPAGWLALAVLIVVPVHMYRQLKDTYELRRSSAIVRTFVLLFFSLIVLVMFFTIIALMGMM
jgi:hypothetical protein